jgi:hypothetical protein
MPVEFDQSELLQDAKGLVWRREQASLAERGFIDPNFIRGTLEGAFKFGDGSDRARAPKETDDLRKLRVIELARAFIDVSNGKAEVDNSASPLALSVFRHAVEGRVADGKGYLLSQAMAVKLGQEGMMTPYVLEQYATRDRGAESVTVKIVSKVQPA